MSRRARASLGDAKAGVRLTSGQQAYVDEVQTLVPFTVTVTSGDRDPEAQARAMLNKLSAKGEGELRTVYRQSLPLIEELLKTPRTPSAWAAVIRAKGSRLSRHLWHGAVDFRTRDLSAAQVDALRTAVRQTGGRPYQEYDHLHADLPAKYVAETVAVATARNARAVAPWFIGAAVASTIVLVIYRRRRL